MTSTLMCIYVHLNLGVLIRAGSSHDGERGECSTLTVMAISIFVNMARLLKLRKDRNESSRYSRESRTIMRGQNSHYAAFEVPVRLLRHH